MLSKKERTGLVSYVSAIIRLVKRVETRDVRQAKKEFLDSRISAEVVKERVESIEEMSLLTVKATADILDRYKEISRDDTGDITPPDTAPPSGK